MSAAILNGMTQAIFDYGADELRIVKTNALTGAVRHYIYDPEGQLLAEMDGATGEPIREYIWLGRLPVGYVDRLGASGASRLFSSTQTTYAARKRSPTRRVPSSGTAFPGLSARFTPLREVSRTC